MSYPTPRQYFSIAGLKVCSQIELWCHRAEAGPEDVTIVLGPVPERHPEPEAVGPTWEGSARQMLLTLEGHGRFWLEHGRTITVEPLPGGRMENIRAFLMATAFGILCHQRGLLPLHAGAVAVEGRAVLIAGDSGTGKSTLTAALHQRGAEILSDDISVVQMPTGARARVPAGMPYIRLWEDALRGVGRKPADHDTELPDFPRYRIEAASVGPDACLPLGAIYLLQEARDSAEEGIVPLTGARALHGLSHNFFRRRTKISMGQGGQIFAWSSRLAREVPVFAFRRVRDLGQLDASTARMHSHAETLLAGTSAA